jgi:hypothetical protein
MESGWIRRYPAVDAGSVFRDVSICVPDAAVSLVGASYSVTSGDLRVLMDQPTDSISSRDTPSRQDDRWFGGPERWRLP